MSRRVTMLLAAGAIAGLGAFSGVCWADQLMPIVAASIHDEPRDGLGDSFNADPFTGLLREQSTREDRAILEYDASAFVGGGIDSATVAGRVDVNNSFDNGVRTFNVIIYSGNGLADLSDFQVGGTVIGSFSYHPPDDLSVTFSFDATNAVRDLLNNGRGFIGVKVDCTSDPNFPNILSPTTSLTIEAGGGSTCTGLERVAGSKCGTDIQHRKLVVKLADGRPGDTFHVAISGGQSADGVINDRGIGKAKFKPLNQPEGQGQATWGCGASVNFIYSCP